MAYYLDLIQCNVLSTSSYIIFFFFFIDPAAIEIYPLSLPDALGVSAAENKPPGSPGKGEKVG